MHGLGVDGCRIDVAIEQGWCAVMLMVVGVFACRRYPPHWALAGNNTQLHAAAVGRHGTWSVGRRHRQGSGGGAELLRLRLRLTVHSSVRSKPSIHYSTHYGRQDGVLCVHGRSVCGSRREGFSRLHPIPMYVTGPNALRPPSLVRVGLPTFRVLRIARRAAPAEPRADHQYRSA